MKHWMKLLAFASAEFAALYGWVALHNEGCENIMRFYVMFVFIVSVVALSVMKPGDITRPPAPKLVRTLSALSDVGIILGLVWIGCFALGGIYLTATLFLWAADTIGRKPKDPGQTMTVAAGGVAVQVGGNVTLSQHIHTEPYARMEA